MDRREAEIKALRRRVKKLEAQLVRLKRDRRIFAAATRGLVFITKDVLKRYAKEEESRWDTDDDEDAAS